MNYRFVAVAGLVAGGVNSFSVPKALSPTFNQRSSPRTTLLSAIVSSNEDLKPGIATIDNANDQIVEQLNELRTSQNFRLYSVDILASCEYMPQELFECYSETCEIYPVDEEEVRAVHWPLAVLRRLVDLLLAQPFSTSSMALSS
jgi:hypothetical protein